MPKPKISEKQTEKALRATGGLMSAAARLCGIAPSTMTLRVQSSAYLQAVRKELEEQLKDEAQSGLADHVREKNLTAIMYYLNNKAQDRGFGRDRTGKVTIDENANGQRRITVEFVGNDSTAA